MATLSIQLLGDFRLVCDDKPILEVNTARLQSLLGYLTLHRGAPQSRQYLAFLLWPDSTEAQARSNLRKAWYDLRHTLPVIDQFVQSDSTCLQWRRNTSCRVDVEGFEDLLAQAEHSADPARVRTALEQALALYAGELLPACYDDWVIAERERLLQRYLRSLEQVIALLQEAHEYAAAVAYAQRLLQADPLQESAYRTLMHLHMLGDDYARALRVYHTCATVLLEELGADPGPATQAVYQRLLQVEAAPVLPASPALPVQRQRLPFVGRQREWALLQRAWETAVHDQPQFVLVSGEAGIGKTHLAEEFRQWADRQGHVTAKARAYAAEGKLAYAPVGEWLRADPIRAQVAQLDNVWQVEVARLLPELLIERPNLSPPQALSDSWQRQRFRQALVRAVQPAGRALLLMLDDLQWCDQETLEWLHYLIRADPSAQLLVVGTVRSEELAPAHPLAVLAASLRQDDRLTEIDLGPLNAGETAELATLVSGRKLEPHHAAALFAETEGYPLFVVEVMRAREADAGAGWPATWPPSDLPSRVRSVIRHRLDQLSAPALALAGLAAVVGRAFATEILLHASDSDEETLVRDLDELWRRRIVRMRDQHWYDFSHDKIREIAYRDISPARRRLLHRRVAQALEHVYAADLDAVSGQIAVQYEQANMWWEAVGHYLRAAEVAQRVFAHAQASALLRKGLDLLRRLPVTPEGLQLELRLQLALGVSLTSLQAVSAPEVKQTYVRACELAQQVGDDRQRLLAVGGLEVSELTRGQVRVAIELVEQCLELVARVGKPAGMMNIGGLAGIVLVHLGQWRASYDQFEQAQAQGHDPWHAGAALTWAQHQGTANRRHQAMALWHLGYPDKAERQMEETLALARKLAHPYNLAAALTWSAWLHQVRREPQQLLRYATEAISLSEQQGFRYWLSYNTILEGWALAQLGQVEQGIAQMQAGLAARQALEAGLHKPVFLAMLAEVYGQVGQPGHGLCLLDDALAHIEATGERFSAAELHRLKGELLQLQTVAAAEIEACFRQALAIARQQESPALELRAATSLARLLQRQGQRLHAYDALAAVYGFFCEGFDTPDLHEARILLASLSA